MVPLLVALAASLAVPMSAQEPAAFRGDLLHADLPLFGDETRDKWPQHFDDPASGDLGCTSRVAFGDWQFRPRKTGDEDDASWYRITNYGVFHCWALVGAADDRSRLDGSERRPAYFVLLERRSERELWTLQLGARPGSEYLLLSRAPTAGLVTEFTILQRVCPEPLLRKRKSLDILLTDYCGIGTTEQLRQIGRRMMHLPPLGTLIRVESPKEGV